MQIRILMLQLFLLLGLSCAKPGPQKPASLPPAAKTAGGTMATAEAATLSSPMSLSAGVAAFEMLTSKLNQAESEREKVNLGAIFKSLGLDPVGTCASTGIVGLLQPGDVTPAVGDPAPEARGLIVYFKDPDNHRCALDRNVCSVTLAPEGKDQVRVRIGELGGLYPEGRLTGTSSGLTAGAWFLEVEMGDILDCQGPRQEGEIEDEGDPGYGEVGNIQNERSGMVVLLFHRGVFHELHRYLSQHSQRSGLSGFINTGSHDVTRINDDRPGSHERFMFIFSDGKKTIEVNPETQETGTTEEISWECFWIDLDGNTLIQLTQEDIATLRRRPEPLGQQCGEKHSGSDPEEADTK